MTLNDKEQAVSVPFWPVTIRIENRKIIVPTFDDTSTQTELCRSYFEAFELAEPGAQ